ncbi:MAG: hypothetical protein LBD67_02245 [Candidatus Accumulibacter sp.]|jgi:hypothetical protein|nr:hypothetical protein [Accumulibacter sp.]
MAGLHDPSRSIYGIYRRPILDEAARVFNPDSGGAPPGKLFRNATLYQRQIFGGQYRANDRRKKRTGKKLAIGICAKSLKTNMEKVGVLSQAGTIETLAD